jgi:hypothetical protein
MTSRSPEEIRGGVAEFDDRDFSPGFHPGYKEDVIVLLMDMSTLICSPWAGHLKRRAA